MGLGIQALRGARWGWAGHRVLELPLPGAVTCVVQLSGSSMMSCGPPARWWQGVWGRPGEEA